MIKSDDLKNYYSGPDDIPPQWHSMAETAEKFGISADMIFQALQVSGLRIRTKVDKAVKFIWEILSDEFGLEYPNDFFYEYHWRHFYSDIYIKREKIAIQVTKDIQPGSIVVVFSGPVAFVKCGLETSEIARNFLIVESEDNKYPQSRFPGFQIF
jgi:hypothetical protein